MKLSTHDSLLFVFYAKVFGVILLLLCACTAAPLSREARRNIIAEYSGQLTSAQIQSLMDVNVSDGEVLRAMISDFLKKNSLSPKDFEQRDLNIRLILRTFRRADDFCSLGPVRLLRGD